MTITEITMPQRRSPAMLAIIDNRPKLDGIDLDEPPDLPSVYGYLRLPGHAMDTVIIGWCLAMRAYSRANGFDLVDIYLDGDSGADSSFCELMAAMEADGVRDIVVPDVERLHPHPALRRVRQRYLDGLNAHLHYS
jgi:hypothetical protein